MIERWKNIIGYQCVYQISSHGRVRSYKNNRWGLSVKPRLLKPTLTGGRTQYLCVNLFKDKKAKLHFVHKLVAQHFLPNKNGHTLVNHKDGDKENNHLYNLEWCSKSEDVQHAWDSGLKPRKYKKTITLL